MILQKEKLPGTPQKNWRPNIKKTKLLITRISKSAKLELTSKTDKS